jgi:hypothetical protein
MSNNWWNFAKNKVAPAPAIVNTQPTPVLDEILEYWTPKKWYYINGSRVVPEELRRPSFDSMSHADSLSYSFESNATSTSAVDGSNDSISNNYVRPMIPVRIPSSSSSSSSASMSSLTNSS